jgi:uncharacterized membrane protein
VEEVILAITFLVTGLMEIIISIPLILEKIQPNYIYGFRVKKTLSNKEIWYKANKYIRSGIIVVIGSIGFFIVEMDTMIVASIGMLLLMVPLIITLFRAFMYLKKL